MTPKQLYECSSCEAESPKWTGQCLSCGAWGTLAQKTTAAVAAARVAGTAGSLVELSDIQGGSAKRMPTGAGELDRVFGGGIVAGSVTLLGGEPGIGKSTLALMLCAAMAERKRNVIYVSGEESLAQIKMRAERMKLDMAGVRFSTETAVENIAETFKKHKPDFAIVDSIQTLSANSMPADAGSTSQLRFVASMLTAFAKETGTATLIIGHVTKDGQVAGPKTLEHMVDVVLSFEGERSHPIRMLRALKNRFGATDETGVFEMTGSGLEEIANPSAYLLEERHPEIPGSVVSCIMEGVRPVLVEIQALAQKSGFGFPARRATGFDNSRLEMLVAILSRRGGMDLSQHDIFVNVVGGIKIKEPAADLAVIAAIASAVSNAPLPNQSAVWGEVGLGGEVRSAIGTDRRLHECDRLGITKAYSAFPKSMTKTGATASATPVKSVSEILALFFAKNPTVKSAQRQIA